MLSFASGLCTNKPSLNTLPQLSPSELASAWKSFLYEVSSYSPRLDGYPGSPVFTPVIRYIENQLLLLKLYPGCLANSRFSLKVEPTSTTLILLATLYFGSHPIILVMFPWRSLIPKPNVLVLAFILLNLCKALGTVKPFFFPSNPLHWPCLEYVFILLPPPSSKDLYYTPKFSYAQYFLPAQLFLPNFRSLLPTSQILTIFF